MWVCEQMQRPALHSMAYVLRNLVADSVCFKTRKVIMNRTRIQGIAKTFLGRLQESVGRLLDDKQMRMRGLQMQVIGYADQAISRPKTA